MGPSYKNVLVQFGIERSGSTLVYQIAKRILPRDYKLIKLHSYNSSLKDSSKVIVTYRDFRDSLVSLWRVQRKCKILDRTDKIRKSEKIKKEQDKQYSCEEFNFLMTRKEIEKYSKHIKNSIGYMKKYRERFSKNVCKFIRYSEFRDNHDIIYEALENLLGIEVLNEKRRKISEEFSIEKNKNRAKKMQTFKEYERSSYIHGDHIYKGAVGEWKNFVPVEFQPYICEIFKSDLLEWKFNV